MKFSDILNEELNSDIKNLEEITRQYLIKLHNYYLKRYPNEEEVKDIKYMKWEFDYYKNMLPFLFKSIKDGNIQNKCTSPKKPYIKYNYACFYNSLVYAKTHDEVDLAFGAAIDLNDLYKSVNWIKSIDETRPYLIDISNHSFCVDKKTKKIIDPTWNMSANGDYYIYQIVPKNIVDKFNYIENDRNFDATEYSNYINNEYKKLSNKFNFLKFIMGK